MYSVKEIFVSVQGEGHNAGRRAVFLRFSGCNMWSGLEADRHKGPGPCSRWCDTDFAGGSLMSEDEVLTALSAAWGALPHRFVVITGGEPALQLRDSLLERLFDDGFDIAIETNGSRRLPRGAWRYWLTVSPKGPDLEVKAGDELKLVFPTLDPRQFERLHFDHFFLQPMDGPDLAKNTEQALAFVMSNPKWRLSLQQHKLLGVS